MKTSYGMEQRRQERDDLEPTLTVDEFGIPRPTPVPDTPAGLTCPLCGAGPSQNCRSFKQPYNEMPDTYHEQRVVSWRRILQMALDGTW